MLGAVDNAPCMHSVFPKHTDVWCNFVYTLGTIRHQRTITSNKGKQSERRLWICLLNSPGLCSAFLYWGEMAQCLHDKATWAECAAPQASFQGFWEPEPLQFADVSLITETVTLWLMAGGAHRARSRWTKERFMSRAGLSRWQVTSVRVHRTVKESAWF